MLTQLVAICLATASATVATSSSPTTSVAGASCNGLDREGRRADGSLPQDQPVADDHSGPGDRPLGLLLCIVGVLLSLGGGVAAFAGARCRLTADKQAPLPRHAAAMIIGLGLQPVAGMLLAAGLLTS